MSGAKIIFDDIRDHKFYTQVGYTYQSLNFYASLNSERIKFCITADALKCIAERNSIEINNIELTNSQLLDILKINFETIKKIARQVYDLGKKSKRGYYVIEKKIIDSVFYEN